MWLSYGGGDGRRRKKVCSVNLTTKYYICVFQCNLESEIWVHIGCFNYHTWCPQEVRAPGSLYTVTACSLQFLAQEVTVWHQPYWSWGFFLSLGHLDIFPSCSSLSWQLITRRCVKYTRACTLICSRYGYIYSFVSHNLKTRKMRRVLMVPLVEVKVANFSSYLAINRNQWQFET